MWMWVNVDENAKSGKVKAKALGLCLCHMYVNASSERSCECERALTKTWAKKCCLLGIEFAFEEAYSCFVNNFGVIVAFTTSILLVFVYNGEEVAFVENKIRP